MSIEFQCSQCSRLLRVPAEAAGQTARCPQCQSLMVVPAAGALAPPLPGATVVPPPPRKPDHPFGESAGGGDPFAPYSNPNPYASPASLGMLPAAGASIELLPINPRPVSLDAILQYAWDVWKSNLGLLVGTTFVFFVIMVGIGFTFGQMQVTFEQQGDPRSARAVDTWGRIISNLVQLFLGIGQSQIALKLARRQQASFGDLFGGLPRFLPVLGGAIIAYVCFIIGIILLIVPGILMALAFWPFYYLIVDRKAAVMESFSVAARITKGNWLNAFVLWLCSVGIAILGILALCVGLLFAVPFITVMWVTAYLMMSGQLVPQPPNVKYLT